MTAACMATPDPASSGASKSTKGNVAQSEHPETPAIASMKEAQVNGQAKESKSKSGPTKPASVAKDSPTQDGEVKLSNAEIKRRNKAEKAARRAATKAPIGVEQSGPSNQQQPSSSRRPSAGKEQLQSPKTLDMGKHHKGSAPTTQGRLLPIRPGGAQAPKEGVADIKQKKKVDEKRVSIFGHLYGQPKRTTLAGAGKEIHPVVLALGLQMRDYVICGSNARCVAMLLCFKRVCCHFQFWKQCLLTSCRSSNHIPHLQVHH